MTDHPAPNPNQPDALVEEVHAKVVDEHYTVMDSVRRGTTNIVDNSRRCHCGHPLPWAGHELAMERHRLAMALAAVLPEVKRRAKANALRTFAGDMGESQFYAEGAFWYEEAHRRADQIEKGDDR